jgi:hypothetical protein
VLISHNALSPFLHFSPQYSSSCNIRIASANFTIMSHQCDLQPTSQVEMDQARRIKCALASESNLEGKCLLYFFLVCLYIGPVGLLVSLKGLSYILHSTFNVCALCVHFLSVQIYFLNSFSYILHCVCALSV